MTEYLSKERVKAFKGNIIAFHAEELGGALPLRAVGFRDAIAIGEIENDVDRAIAFLRLGIPDPETGEPMFATEEEFAEASQHWSNGLFKDLAEKLKELSGIEMEEAEGNLPGIQKGGSPTS